MRVQSLRSLAISLMHEDYTQVLIDYFVRKNMIS